MPTPQKEAIVKDLSERLSRASVIYLADYSGLDVASVTVLRSRLRGADAEMKVIKNNLIRLSLKDTAWEQAGQDLHGPTSIMLGYGDAAGPAKVLRKFAKEYENKPAVKCIGFEEEVLDGEHLARLAAMPTRQEALGMLAGVLNSIVAGFARALNAVREKREQEGSSETAPAEEAETPAAEAQASEATETQTEETP